MCDLEVLAAPDFSMARYRSSNLRFSRAASRSGVSSRCGQPALALTPSSASSRRS